MPMTRPLAVAAAIVVAIALPATASALVGQATITPNRGANGITLGMTRAQVVAKLGKPTFMNGNGFMEYGSKKPSVLFDVYVDGKSGRVRLLGLHGARFCLTGGGPCLEEKGGVGKLKARYGRALRLVRLESGEQVARLTGMVHGCKVFTDFGAPISSNPSARIGMAFIGFLNGSAC
jgi:hypothetical protein